MFRADGTGKHGKRTKIFFIALLAALTLAAVLASAPVKPLSADTYSPPDESIPEPPSSEDVKARQEMEEAAARERRNKAEAAAKAREKARLEAAKSAEAQVEARRREAMRIKAASEDAMNRMLSDGRVLVEDGKFQSALNTLQGFLDANPRSADGWYWISRAHHALGEYDRAQAALNIALMIDPYYPLLYKTPSGLEPKPFLTKQQRKEPRPSPSVLPIKPPLPENLPLEFPAASFPFLTGTSQRYLPYPPEARGTTAAWMQSEQFNEISRWRLRVDRMGILKEPRTAIAWKGTRPYEVYFWTGGEWARIRRERDEDGGKPKYVDILYGARDDMAGLLKAENFAWNESDTPSLAACASLMRYMWVGEIDVNEKNGEEDQVD
jgi:tetratricopeptide (TPR) repeat protein